MIRFKMSKVIGVIVTIVVIFGIAWSIWDINNRFPNAEVLVYTKENPLEYHGVEITPVSRKVYTATEFKKAYPKENQISSEGAKIVVYKVRVENISVEKMEYNFVACANGTALPSRWENGLVPVGEEGKAIRTIEVGEVQEFEVASYVTEGMIGKKLIDKLESNKFYLVFSYYPTQRLLLFE